MKCSILIGYRIALSDHRRRGISIAPMEQMMAARKANLVVRMYEKVCVVSKRLCPWEWGGEMRSFLRGRCTAVPLFV